MGLTRDDIIRRKAIRCSCGKLPIWVKCGMRTFVGCPDHPACGNTLVQGSTLIEAIETWNREEERRNG